MSIILRPRSKAEVDQMIAELKEFGKELRSSKRKARAFLIKNGFITKDGKLTKQYGG